MKGFLTSLTTYPSCCVASEVVAAFFVLMSSCGTNPLPSFPTLTVSPHYMNKITQFSKLFAEAFWYSLVNAVLTESVAFGGRG